MYFYIDHTLRMRREIVDESITVQSPYWTKRRIITSLAIAVTVVLILLWGRGIIGAPATTAIAIVHYDSGMTITLNTGMYVECDDECEVEYVNVPCLEASFSICMDADMSYLNRVYA